MIVIEKLKYIFPSIEEENGTIDVFNEQKKELDLYRRIKNELPCQREFKKKRL